MIFSKETGQILGAQAIGKEGVDKRIDIIATAMKARMTVRDLAQLELAYAPPFGSAKDPINLIGMQACDVLDGLVEQVQWHEIHSLRDVQILDVRSDKERESGFIFNSMSIPLPVLRDRLKELSTNKEIITYCLSGQRSCFASRFLKLNGFTVRNLAGGYLTWSNSAGINKLQDMAGKGTIFSKNV